jgi:tripartite-type tricarboxylate transporter receptor subunit TctC
VNTGWRLVLLGAIAAGVWAMASAARAADVYPSKSIRIVCPFPPGGGADAMSRLLGQKLTDRWGRPVVIDNRAGASGNIGAGIVAKAAPDGHTILLGSASILAASPALQGRPYRAIAAELAPVSLFGRIAYVLAAHPSLPARTVPDLLKHAAAQPGRINYPSSGVGSASHLAMELFKNMARVDLTHVPFKGSAPAAIALIGGEVQVGFNNMVPALPHVKSGRLRALGVSGPARWSGLPDVPAIAASGLPGYEALQWYGVLLPAGTPAAIVSRLNEAIQTVLQLPEVKEQLASEGGEVVGGTPKEFAAYMEREIAKWTKLVKAANIRPE